MPGSTSIGEGIGDRIWSSMLEAEAKGEAAEKGRGAVAMRKW